MPLPEFQESCFPLLKPILLRPGFAARPLLLQWCAWELLPAAPVLLGAAVEKFKVLLSAPKTCVCSLCLVQLGPDMPTC